jgi:hypothetical protein
MSVTAATYAFPGRGDENRFVSGVGSVKPAAAVKSGIVGDKATSFEETLAYAYPGAQIPGDLVAGVDRREMHGPGHGPTQMLSDGVGLSWDDVQDALNPLQHVPVIGTIYRALTGDDIAPAARMAGGTIYGGPLGFMTSLANVVMEEATGSDIGQNVLAMFDQGLGDEAPVQMASLNSVNDASSDEAAAPLPPRPHEPPVQAAASPAAATAAGLPDAAMPKPTGPAPQLSPAAFQALMDSIGATPAPGVNGLAASAKPTTATTGSLAPNGDVHGAAMEIHNVLRGYAADRAMSQGNTLPMVRR